MANWEFNLRSTYIIAIVGFVFDQLTKFVARYYLESQSIDLGLLRFDLVFNKLNSGAVVALIDKQMYCYMNNSPIQDGLSNR